MVNDTNGICRPLNPNGEVMSFLDVIMSRDSLSDTFAIVDAVEAEVVKGNPAALAVWDSHMGVGSSWAAILNPGYTFPFHNGHEWARLSVSMG
jgi:hypothetical protein